MRRYLKVIAIGFVIGLVLFILELSFKIISGGEIPVNRRLLLGLWYYVLYSIPLSFVNGYFFNYLNNLEWDKRKNYRFGTGLLGSVFLTLFTIIVIRVIHRVGFSGIALQQFFAEENPQFYFIALLITLVVSLFFHAIYFYKMAQETKVKEQKFIAGTASAKFESLKNQIDPHFLFNSLNVLTSLIEENPGNAQKFTTSLSKIYRYVLEQKDKELVSVEEELAFVAVYMELLKMRFEESIFYELPDHINNPEAKIVPLSLQLLLENTVKHNIVSAKKPLKIRIWEEDGYLMVENNYQKKEVLQSGNGVGLKNIEERYKLITSRKVFIENTTEYFRVKLPLLTKQFNVMEQVQNNQENAYLKAKERVKEIRGFYGNLLSYCTVIPLLILINFKTSWEFQWFWFPMAGWGIGIITHGFSVFGYGARWEEKKIREIMEKENNLNKSWR